MKTFSRLATTALTVAAIAGASSAWAQVVDSASGTADVNIVKALSITENAQQMEFGSFTAPTDATATLTLNNTTGAVVVAGGNSVVVGSTTTTPALFDIIADSNETVTLDVDITTATIDNVTIGSFTGSYNGNTSIALDGAGTGTLAAGDGQLSVGAQLTVPTTATTGPKQFAYTVNIAYD